MAEMASRISTTAPRITISDRNTSAVRAMAPILRTSVTLSKKLTAIGYCAFNGSTGLSAIELPESLTVLGGSAFSGCTGLTAVSIPAGVTVIGNSAFEGCTGLAALTLQEGLLNVGAYAFKGCTNVNEVICSADASILTWNDNNCDDFKNGKAAAFGALMGKMMAKTQGKCNPAAATEILKSLL